MLSTLLVMDMLAPSIILRDSHHQHQIWLLPGSLKVNRNSEEMIELPLTYVFSILTFYQEYVTASEYDLYEFGYTSLLRKEGKGDKLLLVDHTQDDSTVLHETRIEDSCVNSSLLRSAASKLDIKFVTHFCVTVHIFIFRASATTCYCLPQFTTAGWQL